MTFAKGGLTLGTGTAKVRVRSWECVIGRDRVCRRGDHPDHDPKNAPPEFSTAGFALCLRDPHCLRCAEPWTLLDTNKTAWPCGHAQFAVARPDARKSQPPPVEEYTQRKRRRHRQG